MLLRLFLLLVVLVLPVAGKADQPRNAGALPRPEYAGGETTMNGYTLKQFGDFVHKWHFVTVRFRRDSGEMRFIYANPLAWKTLKAGKIDYPDGAVFAKIGVRTADDPAFLDSAVPVDPARVQIMVRNRTMHPKTHGWGYAMFNIDGRTAPGKPLDEVSEACDACHQLVPQRGAVFAEIMPELLPASAWKKPESKPGQTIPAKALFVSVAVSDLPGDVRAKLPAGTIYVRKMQGAMSDHMFQGSMHESIPLVGAEAAHYVMPAVLVSSKDLKMFSALWPVKGDKGCALPHASSARLVEGVFYAVMINDLSSSSDQAHMQYVPIPPFCAPADAPE